MRCIGTLEFLSDFHNKCHQTQRQLLLNNANSRKLAKDEVKNDPELNKENAAPRSGIETNESGSGIAAQLKRKSSRVENKLAEQKKLRYQDGVSDGHKILGSNNFDSSETNGKTVHLEDESSREIKSSPIESKSQVIRVCKTGFLRKRKPLAMKICKESGNKDEQKNVPETRVGRKKRGKKASSSTITNGKINKTEKRISSSNSEQNISPNICDSAQPQMIGKVENYSNSSKEEQNLSQKLGKRLLSAVTEEINKSERISPELMKIENTDSSNALIGVTAFVKADGLNHGPNDIVISKPDAPIRESDSESTAKSPRPGDEAGAIRDHGSDAIEGHTASDACKIVCAEDGGVEMQSLPKALMIRKSVIESVKNGITFGADSESCLRNGNEIKAHELELINDSESSKKSMMMPQEAVHKSLKGSTKNEERSAESFRERRKKSEGQFGKLSELITNEQKEIIETLYTVNMSVVDETEVYKNIKVLDKMKATCEICGKMYPRMDKCQVHVWGHLNMKPYCCKSCDFVTLTVSNIRCHIRKRHLKIKPFQCNLCEKSYGTAVLLEEHINSHTGAKPYKCKLCDFATSNRQVLSYHKATHKPIKDISCNICGKKFFSNCRMRAHMIVHNKDRNLMCKLCSTYLCNAEALDKHHQKVHSRDYVCNICGVRTRSKKALTNHENVHSEAKYRCPLCSNVYKSNHMLKEHLLKHQGIRKYKCELCEKSFAQQSHIAAHMSVHMGKRYPCPGCNKLFNRRDNMRIHTRRCKIFKSDPDARDLWMRQNPTRPLEEDDQSITASETPAAMSTLVESTENSKTDTGELESNDLGLLRINLLTGEIGCSNSNDSSTALMDVNRDKGFEQFQSGDNEILRIGEMDRFPLTNSNVVGGRSEGNTVITENILSLECF